jgi:hypothetical protein
MKVKSVKSLNPCKSVVQTNYDCESTWRGVEGGDDGGQGE